jgi:hypothetical protein
MPLNKENSGAILLNLEINKDKRSSRNKKNLL